jgi:hypothetical protein
MGVRGEENLREQVERRAQESQAELERLLNRVSRQEAELSTAALQMRRQLEQARDTVRGSRARSQLDAQVRRQTAEIEEALRDMQGLSRSADRLSVRAEEQRLREVELARQVEALAQEALNRSSNRRLSQMRAEAERAELTARSEANRIASQMEALQRALSTEERQLADVLRDLATVVPALEPDLLRLRDALRRIPE